MAYGFIQGGGICGLEEGISRKDAKTPRKRFIIPQISADLGKVGKANARYVKAFEKARAGTLPQLLGVASRRKIVLSQEHEGWRRRFLI